MAQVKASSKGQAWFCTTGLPSDIVIEVGEMSFHLHKQEVKPHYTRSNPTSIEPKNETESEIQEEEGDKESESEQEIQEVDLRRISLPGFPGGTETFEITAMFCYGVKFEMTPFNSIPLHCAAHSLEMAEEFSSENLISCTERYLTQSVFRDLKDSVKALKSCEGEILNFAEELGLVIRDF